MKRVLLATAVSAAFAVSVSGSFAQSSEVAGNTADATVLGQAQQPRGPGGPMVHRGDRQQHAVRMPSERVEARLAYAKTALKITDAQQPQWENFANVLRKHARDMDQRIQQFRAQREAQGAQGQRPGPRSANAIERLERTQQRMQQRAARLNEVIAAAKPLYATFSPEQRQIADAMLARGGHREGGYGHRGMHRGMHRGA